MFEYFHIWHNIKHPKFIQVWIIVQLSEDPDSSEEVRLLGGIPLILSLIQ